jgi:cobalt-zinc-cadmium efflux system outer membrane protein
MSRSALAVDDAGAPELPPRLTLGEAVAMFRQKGFDLLIAQAGVTSAAADEIAAGALPNPNVNGTIGKSFSYNPNVPDCVGCSEIAWSASFVDQGALSNILSGKRGLRVKVARAALEAAKMARADAQRTLEFSVRQQFLDALQAQASLGLMRQAAASATQTFELVTVRYRAGAVSEADLAKIETAKLEADQAVDAAVQALQTSKTTLAFLLGVRTPTPDFELDEELVHAVRPQDLRSSREELVRLALASRPDLKNAAFQRDRAAASIDLARRQRVPDVGLSIAYSQQGTGQNAIQPPTVTFGASVALPFFYQYQGEIAKAEADWKTQMLQLSKTEARVTGDVVTAYAAYTSSRSRIERMQTRLLERAARARDLVQVQYQKGAASLLELLDAQRTFLSTNAEYLQNLNDYWTSLFSLEQAIGSELPK